MESPDDIQRRIVAAMTVEQRMNLAFEMSNIAREAALDMIRREHPEWTHRQVILEWVRRSDLASLRIERPAEAW